MSDGATETTVERRVSGMAQPCGWETGARQRQDGNKVEQAWPGPLWVEESGDPAPSEKPGGS